MSNKGHSRDVCRCDDGPVHDGMMVEWLCRSPLWRHAPLALKKLIPHVRILTDPKTLSLLKAEAARRKQIAGRSCKATGRRHAQ
jgi:hypothetical protein